MNAMEFYNRTGNPPEHDDLDRVNCARIGEYGHTSCGWCDEHNKPRFACGCVVVKKQAAQ